MSIKIATFFFRGLHWGDGDHWQKANMELVFLHLCSFLLPFGIKSNKTNFIVSR